MFKKNFSPVRRVHKPILHTLYLGVRSFESKSGHNAPEVADLLITNPLTLDHQLILVQKKIRNIT